MTNRLSASSAVFLGAALTLVVAAQAQTPERSAPSSPAPASPAPAWQPLPPPIPEPADRPYSGVLTVAVDATDLARHVFAVHEIVPVERTTETGPGDGTSDLVLLYPEWIPGNHGPTGPIQQLAGLTIHAGGTVLSWRRDPVNMYAFHVAVPRDAATLDIDDQFLSPLTPAEGRVVMTPDMLDLQWNTVVLYPAGHDLRDIATLASLRLPDGWHAGTALTPSSAHSKAGTIGYTEVPLNTLFDSPLIAGRHLARLDLNPSPSPDAPAPVHLDIVADDPSELAVTPAQLAINRAIVTQAGRLFGSHHYDHYDFLLCLSDELDGEGLEHHRSSEDCTGGNYFTDWTGTWAERDLLSHEYTHSWNGKYRRPADLYAPDLDVIPERDSLLWVYEGGTEYWGQVLAARSGLWTRQQALDALAVDAAIEQRETGRAWRPLEDTTNDPIFLRRRDTPWLTWEREEDYYIEGLLVWLDADTLIRARTGGAHSLDDFARLFFGQHDGDWNVSTYRFDDIVHALDRIVPYDWAAFLHARLDRVGAPVPLDGITRGGYRLVYNATPNAFLTSDEKVRKTRGFESSIGIAISDGSEGLVRAVGWGTPAWKAGLVEGSTIVAIGDIAFTDPDDLVTAIRNAASTHAPIRLLVRTGRHLHTVAIAYDGGLRYPHLVRDADAKSASLDAILAARP